MLNISTHRSGYTLVELLVTITISILLVTFGVSAYRRSADIQEIRADTETILSTLQSIQKAASSGKEDCSSTNGIYLGERFTTTANSATITLQSICKTAGGSTTRTITLSHTTFSTSNSILFRPINQGVDTGTTTPQYIDFGRDGKNYRIQVDRSGAIKSIGAI